MRTKGTRYHTLALTGAAATLAGAFLVIDLSLPLGVAGGVPYVAVVLLGWWFEKPRAIVWLALISSGLTIVGYYFSPAGGIPWVILSNRFLALFAIWVTAILLGKAKGADMRVRRAHARSEELVKERTKALRDSEQQLRLITDNVPVLISYVDRSGRYRFTNRTYLDWFGLSPDELAGREVRRVLGEPAYEVCAPYIDATLSGQAVSYEGQMDYARGESRYVHCAHVPHLSEEGAVEGFFSIVTDISERKRLESELLHQERLATLGQLTATVSHELRNPLAVIRASAYTLRDGVNEAAPRAQRALERVERSAVRCDRIIDELLDFARISEPKPEATRLDDWLAGVLEEQALPPAVRLHRELGLPEATVYFDHDRLRRAVINVFDNACQAMAGAADKGAAEAGSAALTVQTRETNGRIEMLFEDEGPGIPPHVQEKIFEPLFSTKSFGMGLGLPLVKQIMEQHGGGIEIDCPPGGGTRVCLWLPAQWPGR